MIYREVYPWNVKEEVAAGRTVYVLDKKTAASEEVNGLPYRNVVLMTSDERENRYYFWTELEKEEDDEE